MLRRFGCRLSKPAQSTADRVSFHSGGEIWALPSTGGRSFTGNIFLDEFAYYQHPDEVWDAAAAVTTLGGCIRVCSTPNGVGNAFHKLCKRSVGYDDAEDFRTSPDGKVRAKWIQHSTTVHQAAADGFPVDMDNCWEIAHGDARLFKQLFECGFLDGALQYIPDSAISECSSDNCYVHGGHYYAGLDIGLENDLTALVIVCDTGEMTTVRAIKWCKRTDEELLYQLVAYAFAKYRIRRIAIDSTGLGTFPSQTLRRKYGHSKVEPVVFTLNTKEDLATTMWWYFVHAQLKIPKTDAAIKDREHGAADRLREDVASLQRIITTAGNVRFDAPRTPEGHADTAWALALALHAAASPRAKKTILTDGKPRAT